jgi:polyisoprenoid-binding protein YceI
MPAAGAVQYNLVAEKTTASYKVREQLARLNAPSDAVGKTTKVTGSIRLNADGSIDTKNSLFTVDLASLQTDSSMRDGYVRGNILQTDQYPTATFVPTQISGLPSPLPQSGQVSFKVTGDMTLHNTTKPVTWDVTGQAQADQATGVATTTFKFEDFGLNQPQVPIVLSVVDSITLEVDLTVQRAAQ